MRGVLSLIVSILFFSCQDHLTSHSNTGHSTVVDTLETAKDNPPLPTINGDARLAKYLPLLEGKTVGLVVNQSSVIGSTHLIDTLLSSKIKIQKIFAPEHGIRGKADAGEKVNNSKDNKTGINIVSLYGSHKKPTREDLQGIDVVLFDLQDVGVRFYTYISTMHYVMEACAENNVQVIILDRPNPNGDYVAGPILEKEYKSFVGMHPIPIVHGLTVGELANMILKEGWLDNKSGTLELTVIPCLNYTHNIILPLAVKPSPNLPTLNSIRWYPSLCLLEPTAVSVGRGTYTPFEVWGNPDLNSNEYSFSFEPKSIAGMSKHPKHQDQTCYGQDLSHTDAHKFSFDQLVEAYSKLDSNKFFTSKKFFFKLCGTQKVYYALVTGKSSKEITEMFQTDLTSYKTLRKKYLLYPE